MCQRSGIVTSYQVRIRLKISGQIIGWKVLRVAGNSLRSACFPYVWQPGVNKARNMPGLLHQLQLQQANIHVFLGKKDAESYKGNSSEYRLVPVICKKEHFIDAGYNNDHCRTAMFTEVELSQEEYDKALERN